jgi:lysyl-tRNA synthetase class I
MSDKPVKLAVHNSVDGIRRDAPMEPNILDVVLERLDRIESVLQKFVERHPVKECYSPVEVATILGKKPYTVREWCRLRRINATKRECGRGASEEWEISHEELERIKAHGLLPIPTKY